MYNAINHRRNRETLGEKKVSSSSARWHKGAKTVIGANFFASIAFLYRFVTSWNSIIHETRVPFPPPIT